MHKISCYGGIKLKYLSNLNFYLFYNDYETSYTPLILIMLVGTEICVPVIFVWEETGVP